MENEFKTTRVMWFDLVELHMTSFKKNNYVNTNINLRYFSYKQLSIEGTTSFSLNVLKPLDCFSLLNKISFKSDRNLVLETTFEMKPFDQTDNKHIQSGPNF